MARANQTGGRHFPAAARIGLLLRLGWIVVRRRETRKGALRTRSVLQDATAASRAVRATTPPIARDFFFGANYGVDRNSVGAMFPASLLVLNCWRDS